VPNNELVVYPDAGHAGSSSSTSSSSRKLSSSFASSGPVALGRTPLTPSRTNSSSLKARDSRSEQRPLVR